MTWFETIHLYLRHWDALHFMKRSSSHIMFSIKDVVKELYVLKRYAYLVVLWFYHLIVMANLLCLYFCKYVGQLLFWDTPAWPVLFLVQQSCGSSKRYSMVAQSSFIEKWLQKLTRCILHFLVPAPKTVHKKTSFILLYDDNVRTVVELYVYIDLFILYFETIYTRDVLQ